MFIDLGNLMAIVSLILGIIALIITIVGFFASLKFYTDGVQLQDSANKALAKIEEKTSTIQTQIGGMFDKTLDAAISNNKNAQILQDFEDINDQIENVKNNLVKKVSEEITSLGIEEKKHIEKFLDDQFKIIADQVNVSQENAEDIISQSETENTPITQFQLKIINTLRNSNESLDEIELSKRLGVELAVLSRDLKRLQRKKLVNTTALGSTNKYEIANFDKKDLEILISEAYERASINNPIPHIAKLGVEIKKIDATFHPRKYGYSNLSELLSYQTKYEVVDNHVGGFNHPIIKKIA